MLGGSVASVVLALLVLVPLGAAQPEPEQEALVNSLSVDGNISLETNNFYAKIFGPVAYNRSISLSASQMKVIIENNYDTDPQLQANSAWASATPVYEGAGTIATDAIRDGHRISIVAQDTPAQIFTSGGVFWGKPKETVEREDGYTSERQKETFIMGPQYQIFEVEGRFVVRGNFSFTLYEWDASIVGPDETVSFWTGERHTPLEPMQRVPEDSPLGDHRDAGGRVEWQTAFVYVENGTLEVSTSAVDDKVSAYVGNSFGQAAGAFEMDIGSKSIDFNGSYLTSIKAPRENQLSVVLLPHVDAPDPARPPSGPPDRPAASDPRPAQPGVAPASTTVPALPDGGAPSWVPLLLLPALPLAAVAYLRPARRMKRLEDAFDLGLHPYVLQNAPALVRSRRFGVEASMMYTVALLDERGPDEAESHLRNVRPRSRPSGATYEYLMARIRAAQTRFDEARVHVHACLEEEPAFLVEVRHQPSLRFLAEAMGPVGEGYA